MNQDVFLKKLGTNIALIRKKKGFSQDKLYLEADLSRRTINRIELGEVDPRAGTLNKIAKTLGVDISELFKGLT